jgi:UPF0271 protein
MFKIDLNADLGESPERLADGSDAELMRHITSANVACGGHAGDASTMEHTINLARQNKVAIGAHPSYPDRAGFGRTAIDIPLAELELSVADQINELVVIGRRLKIRVVHVKPHGALYHACNHHTEIAQALCRAVLSIDHRMMLVGQTGAPCLTFYQQMGLRTAAEAFADRTYEPDGSLRDRKLAGASLESAEDAAAQAIAIATRQRLMTAAGVEIPISADTLCIHSDTPNSASIARIVRERLVATGVRVQPLCDPDARSPTE